MFNTGIIFVILSVIIILYIQIVNFKRVVLYDIE